MPERTTTHASDWSEADDAALRAAIERGEDPNEIARTLLRNVNEVVERIAHLMGQPDGPFPRDFAAS